MFYDFVDVIMRCHRTQHYGENSELFKVGPRKSRGWGRRNPVQ